MTEESKDINLGPLDTVFEFLSKRVISAVPKHGDCFKASDVFSALQMAYKKGSDGWEAIAESNRYANEEACKMVWALREENERLKKDTPKWVMEMWVKWCKLTVRNSNLYPFFMEFLEWLSEGGKQ